MAAKNEDEFANGNRSQSGFFHRSLSPRSFERLRTEQSDYFYKPKRGPSTSKSNITITRPIKNSEIVSKLFELLTKGSTITTQHDEPTVSSEPCTDRASINSSLLSMDGDHSSSDHSSTRTSRSSSSMSAVPEQPVPDVVEIRK